MAGLEDTLADHRSHPAHHVTQRSPRFGRGTGLPRTVLSYVIAVLLSIRGLRHRHRGAGPLPVDAFRAILTTSFKSSFGLIETVHKWVPLALQALAFTIPLAKGEYSIGGEGQLLVGATASAAVGITLKDSPLVVLLPMVLLVGLLASGLRLDHERELMDRFGVNEILNTVLLNW